MQVEISVLATAPAPDMQVAIFVDNTQLLASTCETESRRVFFDIDDQDFGNHNIRVIMSGKEPRHTTIDETGNILTDVMIKVESIRIDDIDCTDIFCSGLECYRHDANGTQAEFVDEFYGLLGCNGTATFEFTTPVHLWFLKQAMK